MKIIKNIKLPKSRHFYAALFFVLSWAIMHHMYLGYFENWMWFIWSSIVSLSILFFIWFGYSYIISKFFKVRIDEVLKKDLLCLMPLILLFFRNNYVDTISITLVIGLKMCIMPLSPKIYNWLFKAKTFDILIYVLVILYFLFSSYITIAKHNLFLSYGFDLGIFDQEMVGLSHGEVPFNTIRGLNLLGDHWSPIAFLIAPIYRLFPGPEILLIIQAFAIAVGAIPIYWLSREKWDNKFAAFSVSASYLLYPAIHFLNLFDFHYVALQIPLILFAFYYLEKQKYGKFYISCFFLILCYETASLTVFMFSVYIFIKYKKRLKAIILGIISLGWFLGTIKIIIPYFRDSNYGFISLYSHLGSTMTEILLTLVSKPIVVIKEYIFTWVHVKYILDLLLPVFFTSLLGVEVILLASPSFLMNFLSNRYAMHFVWGKYNSVISAFIFLSLIVGISRMLNKIKNHQIKNRFIFSIPFILLTSSLLMNINMGVCSTGQCSAIMFPEDELCTRANAAETALSMIPNNASVSASTHLVPHLSQRKEIYMFPIPFESFENMNFSQSIQWGPNNHDAQIPEFVVLDNYSFGYYPSTRGLYLDITKSDYRVLFEKAGIILLKKNEN